MSKNITRIVLTGGPAAGKTSLISRVLKEFEQEAGWRVITIPETATELISGFGIKPFGNCLSMLEFQDYVIADQLHKEKLALMAAEAVPEENILIIYDRALLDDKAYISDEEFAATLAKFDGLTEEEVLAGYDAVLHLVTCAKGAEFAYNLGNAARTESIEYAREMDDRTLRAWVNHPNLVIIDNSLNFEEKINNAINAIYRIVGQPQPMGKKRKFLVKMPDVRLIGAKYNAARIEMSQTYLAMLNPKVERRVRIQNSGGEDMYFYTEKNFMPDGTKWATEKPISKKRYMRYLMESGEELCYVNKAKHRFMFNGCRCELDVYPFSEDKAILICYTGEEDLALPEGIELIKEVTGAPEYKNRQLAMTHKL